MLLICFGFGSFFTKTHWSYYSTLKNTFAKERKTFAKYRALMGGVGVRGVYFTWHK